MVGSNLRREELLPNEQVFAHKLKLEAMKRQAERSVKENCSQLGNNLGKKLGPAVESASGLPETPCGEAEHGSAPGQKLRLVRQMQLRVKLTRS